MDLVNIAKFTFQGTHQEEVFKADQSDIAGWLFPDVCACCGGRPAGTIKKKLRAGDISLISPIEIPYCSICLEHVRKRIVEMRIAFAIGIALFFISVLGILYVRSGGDNAGQVPESIWKEALCAIGIGILSGTVFLKSLSKQMPQTPDCTVPLEVTLGGPKGKAFSGTISGKRVVQIHFQSANPAFSDRFREINKESISQETTVPARLHRTKRGDLKLELLKDESK
jgi:hypothetical protein